LGVQPSEFHPLEERVVARSFPIELVGGHRMADDLAGIYLAVKGRRGGYTQQEHAHIG
jgi:hypothetical protein